MKFVIPPQLRFHCTKCGKCCHDLEIPLGDKDYKRLSKIDWEKIQSNLQAKKIFKRKKSEEHYQLMTDSCGKCYFLTEKKHCLIHETKDKKVKPARCQVFPFTFTKIENEVYVGIKFNCPGVLSGKGKLIVQDNKEVKQLYRVYAQNSNIQSSSLAPFSKGNLLPWSEFDNIEKLLIEVMQKEISLLKRLILGTRINSAIKAQASKSNAIGLNPDFLFFEVAALSTSSIKASIGEKRFFIQMLGYLIEGFAPKENKVIRRFKITWIKLLITFGMGGVYPEEATHLISNSKIRKMSIVPPQGEILELLEYYYCTKIYSRNYFGSSFYNVPFQSGFNLLLLTYPLISWMARASAIYHGHEMPLLTDYKNALFVVDQSIYGSTAFAGIKGKIIAHVLATTTFVENIACHYAGEKAKIDESLRF